MTLSDLIQRVSEADGPDRELDCDLYVRLSVMQGVSLGSEKMLRDVVNCWKENGDLDDCVPAYTSSIDAALALVSRLLPGHAAAVGTMAFDKPGVPWATIWLPNGDPKFNKRGATPALAILSALLSALQSQAKPEGEADDRPPCDVEPQEEK